MIVEAQSDSRILLLDRHESSSNSAHCNALILRKLCSSLHDRHGPGGCWVSSSLVVRQAAVVQARAQLRRGKAKTRSVEVLPPPVTRYSALRYHVILHPVGTAVPCPEDTRNPTRGDFFKRGRDVFFSMHITLKQQPVRLSTLVHSLTTFLFSVG